MNISNVRLENDKTYTICFCKRFCISSIRKQKDSFSFPFSEYKERRYKNVFISDKELYIKVVNSINTGYFDDKECDVGFKLVDLLQLKSSKRVANVVINFDGLNVIFGIVKKNNYFIIFPPKEFSFIDEDYKKAVFKYIIDLCKKEGL